MFLRPHFAPLENSPCRQHANVVQPRSFIGQAIVIDRKNAEYAASFADPGDRCNVTFVRLRSTHMWGRLTKSDIERPLTHWVGSIATSCLASCSTGRRMLFPDRSQLQGQAEKRYERLRPRRNFRVIIAREQGENRFLLQVALHTSAPPVTPGR